MLVSPWQSGQTRVSITSNLHKDGLLSRNYIRHRQIAVSTMIHLDATWDQSVPNARKNGTTVLNGAELLIWPYVRPFCEDCSVVWTATWPWSDHPHDDGQDRDRREMRGGRCWDRVVHRSLPSVLVDTPT